MHARHERAEAVRSVPPVAPLRAVTIAELLAAEFPPREMVLSPILPSQGLVLLYAQRGVGKTFLALSIAYAVAAGGRVLKWAAPKPRRVLYIDGEMPAVSMQERLASIVQGSDSPPPGDDFLRVITPDLQDRGMPDLGTPHGQEEIDALLGSAELVIIDSLSTLSRTGIENEAESWLAMQEWALRLRRCGVSVLFVHHAGKSGQQRGTSKREDILDTVVSLRRSDDYSPVSGAQFIVHVEKGRGIHGDDAKPFEANLETRDRAVVWTSQEMEQSGLARVTAYLREGYKQGEIAKLTGLHKSTVSRHARRAADDGLVNLSKGPARKRGDG